MTIASGYTLELYCDLLNSNHEWREFPHEYASDEKNCKAACFRQARKDGWKITRDRQAICPKCSGKETSK